jgi:hypothetical protein
MRRARTLLRRYGHAHRPVVYVTVASNGVILHKETRSAFNSGIRASEAAVREIARLHGTAYDGSKPVRIGDVYTRQWVGVRNGHVVVATITKEGAA